MASRSIPPIVGRKEVGVILGVHPNNTHRNRMPDLPPSLQEEYGQEHVDVAAASLWRRADIERYAAGKAAAKTNA